MISVVVPNYNSGELLKKNLPKLIKLLNFSKLEYEIIVSDDCSTDGSLEILERIKNYELRIMHNSYYVIHNSKNVGFGSTVDRGIKAAKGEIVFILNASDLLPKSPDYFSLMLKHFENVGANHDSPIFSVAAAKEDETGVHGSGKIYFEKGFFLHCRGDGIHTDWADGGAQALRKEYYLKIGGFDPKYFLYWEDVDLGFRAWKAGYKIIYEPKAVLIHQKHEGPIAKKYSAEEIKSLNLKAQYYFTWKNSNFFQKLQFLFWQPYHLAVALRNKICKLP